MRVLGWIFVAWGAASLVYQALSDGGVHVSGVVFVAVLVVIGLGLIAMAARRSRQPPPRPDSKGN